VAAAGLDQLAMAHRILAVVAGLLAACLAQAASAADSALAVPIGYSENLRYFAFEEFGIQDGSGFAYSSIYVIDLSQDQWVVGTPIRMIAESEDETLSAVRANALAAADPRLIDLMIDVPAHELASNGDGAPDTDGKSLMFALPSPGAPTDLSGSYDLQLEQYPIGSGSPCEDWFGEKAVGFILSLADFAPAREIHRDEVLPRSRGCPADYRIHSVYVPFGTNDISSSVALISIYSHGFEGLDRRFIAVTLAKNQVGL
jgi:predicted secreted protein